MPARSGARNLRVADEDARHGPARNAAVVEHDDPIVLVIGIGGSVLRLSQAIIIVDAGNRSDGGTRKRLLNVLDA